MSINTNPNRIKLKNPASKASSDKADRDYDPTVQEVRSEERDVKRKSSSIRLVNPNANKKRKTDVELDSLLSKAKEIEATAAEIEQIESQLALIERQITTKLPSVKLVTHTRTPLSASKKTRNRTKKNFDDDEIDEDDELIEDDDDPYYARKESRFVDQGNNFEESSLTDDDVDFDISSLNAVAATRSKRPPKPSQKYPDHVRGRLKSLNRRERAEQRERERALQQESVVVNHVAVAVTNVTSTATSAPTPRAPRPKSKKPVLDVPFWKPIKAKPNTSSPEAMAQCKKVLLEIQKRPESPSFLEPVNPIALGILDYHKIVKQPMDLSTVQKLLRDKKITSVEQFCQKMRLIWDNAVLYNGNQHEVGKLAIQLSAFFENRMKPILAQEYPQEVDASELRHKINVYTREYKSLQADLANLNSSKQSSSTELNPADPNIDLSPQIGAVSEADCKKTFEHAEKCQLYNAINGLQPCFLRGLYQLVMDSYDKSYAKSHTDHLEIDTDAASPLLLTKLQLYIKECQAILNKDKKGPSVEKTPGKQTAPVQQKEKSVESEKSSSTSESDSDSDDSSAGDPRLKTSAFVGIFDEKKQQAQKQPLSHPPSQNLPPYHSIQPQATQPQKQPMMPHQQVSPDATSKLIYPTSPKVEERKPVVLLNSESWSQLPDSFDTPQDNSTNKTPTNDWESLKNRKTQLEQLEKEKEEQEILKNQQIKMKAEEEAKRMNEELLEMKRQADREAQQQKLKEEQERAQNIARMRELEREKRERELSSGVLKQPVNMMDQFEIMKSFQANFMPPK